MRYSPSSREEFSFCPRKWWLRKQGWVSQRIGYPELCAIGGAAVGVAMEHTNKAIMSGKHLTMDEAVAYGLQSVVEQTACRVQAGRRVTGLKDLEFQQELPQLVELAIRAVIEADPLKGHTLLEVEREYVDYGNARPDITSRDPQGQIVVDDYKCKFGKWNPEWADGEFGKHFDGEQRLAYTTMTRSNLFGIILIVPRPVVNRVAKKPVVIRRVSRVQQYEQQQWINDSMLDYQEMEQVLAKQQPWEVRGKAGGHSNQYGECVYRDACIDDNLAPGKMAVRYVQITKGGQ